MGKSVEENSVISKTVSMSVLCVYISCCTCWYDICVLAA